MNYGTGLFKQPFSQKSRIRGKSYCFFFGCFSIGEKNGLIRRVCCKEPADLESPVGKAQSLASKALQQILTQLGLRTSV